MADTAPWQDYAPGDGPWQDYAQPEGGGQASSGVRRGSFKIGAKTIEFDAPVGASDNEIRRLAKDAAIKSGAKGADTSRAAVVEAGTKTDHSWLHGLALGAVKPLDNLALAASHIPYVGPALDQARQYLGKPSIADTVANANSQRENNDRSGAQTIGNIAGTLPAMALPGGALVQGAASGALLSDSKDALGVAKDTAVGAGTAFGAGKLLSGVGSVMAPQVSKAAQALNKAGIPLTLGQLAKTGSGLGSKMAYGVEAGMRKLPLLKSLVANAEDRGIAANYNAVIARTGVKVPDSIAAGHETTAYVGEQLSKKYEALLPKLNVAADDKMNTGLAKVGADLKAIAPTTFNQFKGILRHAGLEGKAGGINGASFQQADRVLRTQAEKFSKSLDPNQQEMGAAFDAVRQQLRGMLMRQNPEHAAELSALNKNWRELAIARKAAGDPNKGTGVFTPARYATAAKGSRSNQELTRSADQILPNRSPDPGTAEGVAWGHMLAGGAAGAATHLVSPYAAIPAAASAFYTKAGQTVLNKAYFATRPGAVRATGKALKDLAKFAPATVAVTAPSDGR